VQSIGQVDRVADHGVRHTAIAVDLAGDDQSGMETDACPEIETMLLLDARLERGQNVLHIQGGPDGPFRVVFVRHG
jgi:hypothetical protein